MTAPADVLVVGGIVVTMNAARTVLPEGALAIRDGAIVVVGPRDDVTAAWHAPTVVDASGDLVIPGLIFPRRACPTKDSVLTRHYGPL